MWNKLGRESRHNPKEREHESEKLAPHDIACLFTLLAIIYLFHNQFPYEAVNDMGEQMIPFGMLVAASFLFCVLGFVAGFLAGNRGGNET